MRTGIITKLTLVALLCVLVGGCRKQDKAGEAFVVLKSGEVIYMADMEVVCLKPSFKNDFNTWKTEYESQDKSLVRRIETGNSAVKAKLKDTDDGIAELNAKISGMSLNESLSSLRRQREDFLQEAAENAKKELKGEYRQKFFELIRKVSAAAVRTGSKGDFIVSGEAAYLFAQTQRDNGEKLAWLVRIDPNAPKIKMSVSNAASAGGNGDFDEFWMLRWILAE